MTARRALLLATALALGGCAFPVQGAFIGRELPDPTARPRTILIIYNHGFSGDTAGTYRPRLPPIFDVALKRNADVVVYSQVRNTSRLNAIDHGAYIEAAVEFFHRRQGMPLGNIILAGQSCGGWGSLQAAAFAFPEVGGVAAFAPTCHGRLPHSSDLRARRSWELAQLAQRARFPGLIFVYEGDTYYDLGDWTGFETRLPAGSAGLRIERLPWKTVVNVCARCTRDSHGAVWDNEFAAAYFESHLQPLIERVRAGIRLRMAAVGR